MGLVGGQLATWIVGGSAAVSILSFMDALEEPVDGGIAPNATLTKFLLFASVLLFWIPVVGLILISYALHRSRWVDLDDGIGCFLSGLFFLSIASTIVCGMIVSIDGM